MTEPQLEQSIFGPETPAEGPAPDDQPSTRAERRAQERHGDSRRSRRDGTRPRRGGPFRAIVIVLALAVIGGGGYIGVKALGPIVSSFGGGSDEPVDFTGQGTTDVQVTVAQGDTGADIADTLREAGVIRTREAWFTATQVEPDAANIQPGTYNLRKEMKASLALGILVDPANRVVDGVTVREGLWASEIYPLLSKETGIPLADYTAAAKNPTALGLPAAAKGNVEGYLFPSTYEFAPQATAVEQLKTMVAETLKQLQAAGVDPADYERTMIVASIIEGEVNFDDDRPKVARVILNRQSDTSETNGLLQMDSTIHYLTQQRGAAGTSDEARASNSAYNTYKFPGLPPGPINNPGAASIKAAANPADGPWQYFVTTDPSTGETKFATTYAEHLPNVAEFEQWCSDNPGQC